MQGRRDDEELMRYADGELAPRDARSVEAKLPSSPGDRARVESIRQIGDVIRARAELAMEEKAPRLAAMWAQLEDELPSRAVTAPQRRTPGLMTVVREWFESYRGHVFTGAACAAVAAVLVLLLAKKDPQVVHDTRIVYVQTETSPKDDGKPAPEPEVMAAEFHDDPTVDSLDVPEGTSAIFTIPGDSEDEDASNVIWITPDEGSEGPI